MNMKTWLIERLGGLTIEQAEQRGGFEVYLEAYRSNVANAGTIVTPETAMQLSAVFACARVLAETMASVPLHWYQRQTHLALRGNAYCQIEYDERGRITEFWPLLPQNFISWKVVGSRRIYQYMDPDGKIRPISSEILWHLRGLGDGLDGYSPIGLMRRAVSLGMSAEEFGNRFFENDARPGVVLEHPGR